MCFSSTAVFDEIVTLGQKCGAHAMMLNYPLLLLQSNSTFTTLGPLLDPISKLRQRPTIPLSLSLSLSLLSLKVADSRTAHFLVLRSAAAALNLATCSNSFRYAQKIKGPLSFLLRSVPFKIKSGPFDNVRQRPRRHGDDFFRGAHAPKVPQSRENVLDWTGYGSGIHISLRGYVL